MILRRRVIVGKGGGEVGYVDLGLPSGLLWAQYNIGVTVSEGYGEYFSWGNIVGHKAGDGYIFSEAYYNVTPGNTLIADILPDDIDHDAALVLFGSPWRLPTKNNFQELYDNTDSVRTSVKGIEGWKFMKKTDHSVFVFFPFAGSRNNSSLVNRGSVGLYWASSYNSTNNVAYYFGFDTSAVTPQDMDVRYKGFTIRPVRYPEMEYVDLGLPSGLKWATCNLGATTPEASGLYFTWGDITGYAGGSGHNFNKMNYNDTKVNGANIKNISTNLPLSNDAAHQMLGDKWRIPSKEELQELCNYTDITQVTINGERCSKITSKENPNAYIILPTPGYYNGTALTNNSKNGYLWSSTYSSNSNAYSMDYTGGGNGEFWGNSRYFGFTIRPVYDPSLL